MRCLGMSMKNNWKYYLKFAQAKAQLGLKK